MALTTRSTGSGEAGGVEGRGEGLGAEIDRQFDERVVGSAEVGEPTVLSIGSAKWRDSRRHCGAAAAARTVDSGADHVGERVCHLVLVYR